jgi:small-conductance mechanosensitive channel
MTPTLSAWLQDPRLQRVLMAALGLAVIVIITLLLRRAALRHVHDNSTRYQVRKALNFAGTLAVAVLLAVMFVDELGGLTVALGVAGAGVAFALQEVIASVAGWVAVSFGGFYRVGDRVQLGGIKGDVIDIGVLRTTVMEMGQWVQGDSYNGRIVRVANSFVFKEPVFNYSGEFPFLWDEIVLPIRHGSDVQAARELIQQAADTLVGDYARAAEVAWKPVTQRYLIEKASVQPQVSMAFDANAILFTLRYVVDYKSRRPTKNALFTRVLEAVAASQGRVAVATSTLDIEKLPPLRWQAPPTPDAPVAPAR